MWGLSLAAAAQSKPGTAPAGQAAASRATAGEQRALRAFAAAKANKANALAFEGFLAQMPKGADLHMHLSGAVYAETFLRDAAIDNLCVNPKTLSLAKNAGMGKDAPVCAEGTLSAASVFHDQRLYDELVDAFSMRSFVPSAGLSGHDQFFATFDRFSGTDKVHTGEWLDEVATRAAAQNEQYLEIMYTPDLSAASGLVAGIAWPQTPATTGDFQQDTTGTSRSELATLLAKVSAGSNLAKAAQADRAEFDRILADRNRIEHCGQVNAAPGCAVKIRLLFQVLRAMPPSLLFAQTLLAFDVASSDPEVVGLNFVQPEDNYVAMSEYTRQMRIVDFLHSVYPRVHVALHAGELAPGLVPPEGMRFHIRQAVELGHAERIGHGVDVLYEDDPRALLKEMAERHVMVEINLTSNDAILGIVPPYHPLPEYREAQVPVALATDDEGVARIDLTHEYVRAAMEYGLGYLDLKAMARASLEHSFLPGESLWAKPDVFTRVKPVCAAQAAGSPLPTADCLALLKSSEKAAQQWELEHRFSVFETKLP